MCTRVFRPDSGAGPVSARTFDFFVPANPSLWWIPRGDHRSGGPGEASWTADFASACVRDIGIAWVDGINEAGLAAHLHVFRKGRFPGPDGRPDVHASIFVRWLLGTNGSVAEALERLSTIRISDTWMAGVDIPDVDVSFALEDASGDSAIIEGIDGELLVHRGMRTHVHSNAPGLDAHLDNLTRYEPFGGDLPVPGNVTARDRFVRASYFLHYLPQAADMREALAQIGQVAHTVALPSGAPYPSGDVFPTRWISAYDLQGRTIYLLPQSQPFLLWLELDHLRDVLTPMSVDIATPGLQGDLLPDLAEAERVPD